MISPQIIRSNRKTLSLSINENSDLVVRAPHRVSDDEIQKFISEKSAWIERLNVLRLLRMIWGDIIYITILKMNRILLIALVNPLSSIFKHSHPR